MSYRTSGLVSLAFMLATANIGLAQTITKAPSANNEIGLVIGATETPSIGLKQGGTVNLNSSLALGAEYDHHLVGRRTTLEVGVDFLASPFDVKVSHPAPAVSPEYAYIFLAPHARVKFNSDRTVQPWLLFGGGFADFSPAQPRSGGVNVAGSGSSGTLEFGGGIDTKPLIRLKGLPVVGTLPIGARIEVRDFYSGHPNYGLETNSSFQNNVSITGGLLLHF